MLQRLWLSLCFVLACVAVKATEDPSIVEGYEVFVSHVDVDFSEDVTDEEKKEFASQFVQGFNERMEEIDNPYNYHLIFFDLGYSNDDGTRRRLNNNSGPPFIGGGCTGCGGSPPKNWTNNQSTNLSFNITITRNRRLDEGEKRTVHFGNSTDLMPDSPQAALLALVNAEVLADNFKDRIQHAQSKKKDLRAIVKMLKANLSGAESELMTLTQTEPKDEAAINDKKSTIESLQKELNQLQSKLEEVTNLVEDLREKARESDEEVKQKADRASRGSSPGQGFHRSLEKAKRYAEKMNKKINDGLD